jgi:hypothetical protein
VRVAESWYQPSVAGNGALMRARGGWSCLGYCYQLVVLVLVLSV